MKKITYILVAILILTISFEPLSNIYYENKRIKNEKYLAEYLSCLLYTSDAADD